MAGINLRGETSGSVEITSPAVAGDTSITLPTTNGTLVVEQTDRVSFASSVGIGTTQPEHALVVADTGELSRIRIRNDTASSGRYASLNLKTAGFDNGWSIYSEYNSSDTDNYLKIFKGDGTSTHMYFKDPAEVGIRSAFYHVDANGSDNGDSCFGFISTSSNPGFKIKSGGTERLRVQNNGRVGINTDNPAHMLVLHTVSTTGYSTATADTANPNTLLHLENQNGNDGAGVDNYVAAEFSVGRGATSQGFLGYTRTADNQGAFFIKQRNAASSYPETIRFPSSGGVTFGGGANTANTLDDYEEGTFTPEFANAASGGTESGSYATQTGRYTKIGNLVHIDIYLKNVDTTGLGTGQFFVRGLPFTVKSGSIHIGACGLSDVDLNSTASALYSFANASGGALSALRVFQTKDNTGHSAVPCDAVNDGDNEIFITMTYPTDS